MNKPVIKGEYSFPKRIVYLDDPLASLLINKCHLGYAHFSIVLSIVIFSACFLTAWASGVLNSRSGNVGFLQDWLGLLWTIVIHPVLGGAYLWSTTAISDLGCQLRAIKHVNLSVEEIDTFSQDSKHSWCKLLAFGMAAFGSTLYYASRSDINTWTSSALFPKLMSSIFVLLGIYMAAMLSFNLLINMDRIYLLFDGKEIQLSPLHPDQCGGLKPLSDYSLKTAYIAAFFGLMLGFGWYRFFINQTAFQQYWYLMILTPAYVLASCLCFLTPLFSAHVMMKSAKTQLLETLAQQFQHDYVELQSNLTQEAEYLEARMMKIEKIQGVVALTNQFSTWPFNASIIRKYALSISTPMLPTVLKLMQEGGMFILKQVGIMA